MKKKKTIVLMLFSLFMAACSTAVTTKKNVHLTQGQMGFTRVMDSLIDQFAVEMKYYKSNVNLVGLIKILSSSDNSSFKIQFEGLNGEENFDAISVDNYFLRDSMYFVIDYNHSGLLKSAQVNKTGLLTDSKIKTYKKADTRLPAWRVLISGKRIVKINKFAQSVFKVQSNSVMKSTPAGLIPHELTEWGEIINDKGEVVGHFDHY